MAADFTQESILDFLKVCGGKVRNTDLIEQFKAMFPEEPEKKAVVRSIFKKYVDNIAIVKAERGIKYVCLKKRFRATLSVSDVTDSSEREAVHTLNVEKLHLAEAECVQADDAAEDAASGRGAQHTPGSGYGNDSQVKVPHVFSPATILSDDKSGCQEFVLVFEDLCEMGNIESFRRDKRESKKDQVGQAPVLPRIAVIEASSLPVQESMLTLPGLAQIATTEQLDSIAGLRQTENELLSVQHLKERGQINVEISHPNSTGYRSHSYELEDEGQLDARSLSESEGNSSPSASRRHFIEVMMTRSPQVCRNMVVLRRSVCDSDSLVSSNLDDDSASVILDPVEHEWMMCASDGEWASLHRLLSMDPSLVLRKDFITGFTCLHWAAKHGNHELLALIFNFAKQHNIPISVDVRSKTGYTPLHVAAMQNHMEVVKLLVGAYSADIEIRDHSGRKACQYLTDGVSVDIRDIIGAYKLSETENANHKNRRQWKFSKVLQTNLKPQRPGNSDDCYSVDGEVQLREKPIWRRSSFKKLKPKLERMRFRASQIIHSTTFRDTEEEQEGSAKSSFRSRPKTHYLGSDQY